VVAVNIVRVVGVGVIVPAVQLGLLFPHETCRVVGDRAVGVIDEARTPTAAGVKCAASTTGQCATTTSEAGRDAGLSVEVGLVAVFAGLNGAIAARRQRAGTSAQTVSDSLSVTYDAPLHRRLISFARAYTRTGLALCGVPFEVVHLVALTVVNRFASPDRLRLRLQPTLAVLASRIQLLRLALLRRIERERRGSRRNERQDAHGHSQSHLVSPHEVDCCGDCCRLELENEAGNYPGAAKGFSKSTETSRRVGSRGDQMEGPPIHVSRLPVFTNWNPRCRHCGNTYRIRVHYDRVCWGVIGGEHYHRICERCGHRWVERLPTAEES